MFCTCEPNVIVFIRDPMNAPTFKTVTEFGTEKEVKPTSQNAYVPMKPTPSFILISVINEQ